MHALKQACLFDLGLDLRPAEEVKLRVMSAQYAKNTIIAYESAWRLFQAWCREAGRESLPASPETLIDHAAWLIAQGLRLDTVHGRLKAANHYHRQQALPLPFDASVREFLRNARRALCEKPQGKDALPVAHLRNISRALSRSVLNVSDIEDRAMILLCFASGWRCSELVSLDLADIRWVEEGILLRLGKSKTDQQGRGRLVGIQYGRRPLTCPIRALQQWIATRGTWPGPLFVACDNWRRLTRERLDPDGVRRAVKRGLERIGVDARRFGAHSLRAGMATAAAESGADLVAIMQRGGWKKMDTVLRYIRPTEVFARNPLKGVL